jgi:chromosomal replication initiator protein
MPSEQSTEEVGLWERALSSLEERIQPNNFDMWLRPIRCTAIDGCHMRLKAPNRYIKEWFEDNYLDVVLQELRSYTNRDFEVVFELAEPEAPPAVLPEPVSGEPLPAGWDYELNRRYQFDSFVVGPSNQLAHAAARAVVDLPAAKYNPLFIYGGVGLGKTHLLCAIGHEIRRRRPSLRLAYLSSERFMNEYIHLVRSNRIEEFRARYRVECDALLMDDIQFIAGKDQTQNEFFHTFNALYDSHRQIVVTADKYPREIPDLEDRLRTRFQWGLIADIQQPELETRIAILKKKAEGESIALADDVALYLATNIKSNVRELEGSLIRLAALASIQASEISVEFARETLKNLLSQTSSNLSIETIQKEVSAYFSIKVADLKGSKRHKAVARPRQIAMYLCRKLTGSSFPEIGQRFGKDHSTVISAYRKVEELVEKDLGVRTAVQSLERQLQL